jgi:hypothetical protein
MARPHPDELPAHMAVLGLVIERPNQTPAWYSNALAQRFPRAGFGDSTAHNALRQMATGRTPRVRASKANGRDRAMDRYEATAEGDTAFFAWMFEPPTAIPLVRQAIYGRIELVRLPDLPRLIRVVETEEAIATHLYQEATKALRRLESAKRSRRSGAQKTLADFERDVHETWLYVGPLHWSSRGALCLTILERLEEIAQEAQGAEILVDMDEPKGGHNQQREARGA